jgi:hypothetical protein
MSDLIISSWGIIRKNNIRVNGIIEADIENNINFATFIKSLYKREQLNYPKFYKMDNLSKLGFITAELVLRKRNIPDLYKKETIGVMITNSSSSLDTDINFQATISDAANYFPSPSVFVYTLPNILIGEICIRNGIKGENAFLISQKFDARLILTYVENLMNNNHTESCLCGWVELIHEKYESFLMIIEKEGAISKNEEGICRIAFTEKNITQLYLNNGN